MLSKKKIKVVHFITGLTMGGAEKMLFSLIANTNPDKIQAIVISLGDKGDLGKEFEILGIPVYELELNKFWPALRSVTTLKNILGAYKPDIIHTWMYHADFIGGIVGKILKTPKIIWHLHNSQFPNEKRFEFLSARIIRWINSRLSFFVPDVIVSCSTDAKAVHAKIGYKSKNFIVIPNGFDLSLYRYSVYEREKNRKVLGIPANSFVIGMVARFSPQKDYATFIKAANRFGKIYEDVFFVLIGKDVDWHNPFFTKHIDFHMKVKFRLLGLRDDVSKLLSAMDIFSLSSFVEAFPVVIGESMATEIPCVATDVGDVTFLIGDTGIVVPPKDIQKLIDAWEDMALLSLDQRKELGKKARTRIIQEFSIDDFCRRFENLYKSLVCGDLPTV